MPALSPLALASSAMPEPDILERMSRQLPIGGSDETASHERPASAWAAMTRGALGRCPSCGSAKLFGRFLKPVAACPRCEEDWSPQQADDFPAYVAIFLTGHMLAPLIILLVKDTGLSVPVLMAIILPLAIVMMVGLLQPAKGAIIAIQWWFGMHGFPRHDRPR